MGAQLWFEQSVVIAGGNIHPARQRASGGASRLEVPGRTRLRVARCVGAAVVRSLKLRHRQYLRVRARISR